MPDISYLRDELVRTAETAYRRGLVQLGEGNFSVRVPARGILITPTGARYERMKGSDILLCDADGRVIEGELPPTSEIRLHLAIYRARPAAGAVIHVHSPFATAFAAAGREIPAILEEGVLFAGGTVRCAEYALTGSDEVGSRVLEAMVDRNAALLRNHGVVCTGRDLRHALVTAMSVERSAQVALLSEELGGACAIPRKCSDRLRERFVERWSTEARLSKKGEERDGRLGNFL